MAAEPSAPAPAAIAMAAETSGLARVRLLFDDDGLLSRQQRLEGLGCSWVPLRRSELPTVADVADFVARSFGIRAACPDGLVLSIDGFVLPPFISSNIIRENDVLSVRRKLLENAIDQSVITHMNNDERVDNQVGIDEKVLAVENHEIRDVSSRKRQKTNENPECSGSQSELEGLETSGQNAAHAGYKNLGNRPLSNGNYSPALNQHVLQQDTATFDDSATAARPGQLQGAGAATGNIQAHSPQNFHAEKGKNINQGQNWNCGPNTANSNVQSRSREAVSEKDVVTDVAAKSTDKVDFKSLYPLTRLPKEGDLIVYRLLEMSPSMRQVLCTFRVGEVVMYEPLSQRILVKPVPEYPFLPNGANKGDSSDTSIDTSLYNEDGSLEIEYASLVDVRLLKSGAAGQLVGGTTSRETMSRPQQARSSPAAATGSALAPTDTWEAAAVAQDAVTVPASAAQNGNGNENNAENGDHNQVQDGWDIWAPNRPPVWPSAGAAGILNNPGLGFRGGRAGRFRGGRGRCRGRDGRGRGGGRFCNPRFGSN